MPKFNRENILRIIESGSREDHERLLDSLERALQEDKHYGLVWERGGEDENSPFEAEDVVLQYTSHIPYPVYREDLSSSNERERERERTA